MEMHSKSDELAKILSSDQQNQTAYLELENDFNSHAFSSFYLEQKERDEIAILNYL